MRMEALSQLVTSGSRGWAKYYSNNGATFIRMGNLDHETIALDMSHVQKVTPPEGAEGMRSKVRPNDILISITAELGMIALIPDGLDESYINQHVALARPVQESTGKYLAWYLASRNGSRQLNRLRRGATKTGLGLDDIRAVNVALPPLEEQEQIVTEVERRLSIIQEVEAEVETNLKRASRLRQSIPKRAFEGKLVPQDPADEPASELLERIKEERTKAAPRNKRRKKSARAEEKETQIGLF